MEEQIKSKPRATPVRRTLKRARENENIWHGIQDENVNSILDDPQDEFDIEDFNSNAEPILTDNVNSSVDHHENNLAAATLNMGRFFTNFAENYDLQEELIPEYVEEYSDDEANCETASDCDMEGFPENTEGEKSFEFNDMDDGKSPKFSKFSEPLYENSPISLGISLLLILAFVTKFKITGQCLEHLLLLLEIHCIKPNRCVKSVYLLKKAFVGLDLPIVTHYFCRSCFEYTEQNAMHCQNPLCNSNLEAKQLEKDCFFEASLEMQIRNFFKNPGFFELLQKRFERPITSKISDVYDGTVHQSNANLKNPQNISLTWNTDGIPLFNSSKFSFWPLYFIINELPINIRMKRENMILAGLWCGYTKPVMTTYLRPFYSVLKKFENEGILVETSDKITFVCKIFLLCGSFDLPAKAMVLNMRQFNGLHGCARCKQPGETVRTASGGNVHCYPFNPENPKGPLRTKTEFLQNIKDATNSNTIVNGVKGISWFAALQYYDIIEGTGIDYMHGALGHMKQLLHLWLDSCNSREVFSISKKKKNLDEQMKCIFPPNSISRCPRPVSDLKHWKASEFRSFLLFYGPVVLRELLPQDYFQHFLHFSEAIWLLLKSNLRPEEINYAEHLLMEYCRTFSHFYDARYMTINAHNLLHLSDSVRCLGPLFTHSCFHFEDKNSYVLKMFHGTQNISVQVLSALGRVFAIPKLEKEVLLSNEKAKLLYHRLLYPTETQNETPLNEDIFCKGKIEKYNLKGDEFIAFSNYLQEVPVTTNVERFYRIRSKNEIYHSVLYTAPRRRNSYTVKLKNNRFAQVQYYFKCKPYCICQDTHMCLCEQMNFAFVKVFLLNTGKSVYLDIGIFEQNPDKHIVSICYNNFEFSVIKIADILEKVVFLRDINDESNAYVALFPNKNESP